MMNTLLIADPEKYGYSQSRNRLWNNIWTPLNVRLRAATVSRIVESLKHIPLKIADTHNIVLGKAKPLSSRNISKNLNFTDGCLVTDVCIRNPDKVEWL